MKKKQLQYVYFGLIAAFVPFIIGINNSTITLLATLSIFSIAALGYNILLGYAGLISLGHGAFMGLGAYFSAYLVTQLHLPFILGLIASAIVPLLVGLLLGMVALRLEGHYLAIATLGLAVVLQQVFAEASFFTGGWTGIRAKYPVILGYALSKNQTYILSIVILVALMVVTYNFIKASTGRALIAMKESEHAAQAMGISLFKYKLIAFSASTMYAGIAGCLYMHFYRFIQPELWGMTLSLNILAAAVIGGLGTIGGSVIGIIFLKILPPVLQAIPVLGEIDGLSLVLTGAAIIIIITFYPKGLINITSIFTKKKTKKEKTKQEVA